MMPNPFSKKAENLHVGPRGNPEVLNEPKGIISSHTRRYRLLSQDHYSAKSSSNTGNDNHDGPTEVAITRGMDRGFTSALAAASDVRSNIPVSADALGQV